MANQNVSDDACNLEISTRPEPHLEASQDLELLAQEIAEAAVEEERRSSNASSPTPSQSQMSDVSTEMIPGTEEVTDTDKQEFAKDEDEEEKEEEEDREEDEREEEEEEEETPDKDKEKNRVRGRSQSPVDETSWEIVDAEEEPTGDDETMRTPEQKYCIVRKFLGCHDLWQKLKDIGMVCDICTEENMDSEDNRDGSDNQQSLEGVNNLLVSCSESMVICDMPQDAEQAGDDSRDEEEVQYQLPMMEVPEDPKLPSWQGRIAGAMVVVELERLGGLLVASVKVNHTDLLSALASLQQLAASVGLVSYADVDVQSLLARAA